MPPRKVTDEQIMIAVRRLRNRVGACSYGTLADEIGLSKRGAQQRVERMRRDGFLTYNENVSGSIRLGPKAPQPHRDFTLRLFFDGTGKPMSAEVL